jgi:hypothetical protein
MLRRERLLARRSGIDLVDAGGGDSERRTSRTLKAQSIAKGIY